MTPRAERGGEVGADPRLGRSTTSAREPHRDGRRIFVTANLLLCLVAAVLLGTLLVDHLRKEHLRRATEIGMARGEFNFAVNALSKELRWFMDLATSLAEDLGARPIPDPELRDHLRHILEQNRALAAAGVAYAPGARGDKELHAPSFVRTKKGIGAIQVEEVYDYTKSRHAWYQGPLRDGTGWSRPYFSEISSRRVVVFGCPIRGGAGEGSPAAGVVFLHYPLDELRKILKSLDIGKRGYAFAVSRDGYYLYHPRASYLRSRKTLADLSLLQGNEQLGALAGAAREGRHGFLESFHASGAENWLFYGPVPDTGWMLGGAYVVEEVVGMTDGSRRRIIRIVLAAMALLWLLSNFLVILFHREGRSLLLGAWSLVTTLLLLAGILINWALALSVRSQEPLERNIILKESSIALKLIEAGRQARANGETLPIPIRTGLEITSLKYGAGDEAILKGYVWQQYDAGIHDGLSRGILIPGALSLRMEEAYRKTGEEKEIIGWSFEGAFPLSSDFRLYPFDRKRIALSIRHRDIHENILLVPDLDAYEQINPTSLPGVGKDATVLGWEISSSSFEIVRRASSSSMGVQGDRGEGGRQEIVFNVVMHRHFLAPIITNLFPVLFAAVIVFIIVLAISIEPEKRKTSGFSPMGLLGTFAALFFTMLIAHIRLRSEFPMVREIMYLEYFYFAMYPTILWGLTLAFLVTNSGLGFWLLRYQDNLLSKVFFWPIFMGILFAVTLFAFYYP